MLRYLFHTDLERANRVWKHGCLRPRNEKGVKDELEHETLSSRNRYSRDVIVSSIRAAASAIILAFQLSSARTYLSCIHSTATGNANAHRWCDKFPRLRDGIARVTDVEISSRFSSIDLFYPGSPLAEHWFLRLSFFVYFFFVYRTTLCGTNKSSRPLQNELSYKRVVGNVRPL